jgi:RNA polymerase sigma-70 factor (ECF subfamily)
MLVTMSDSPASASAAPQSAAAGLSSSGARRTVQAEDEVRLVARAVAGDTACFDRLVTVHQDRIARLVHRLLGWPSEVDDIVQDVFVDALGNLTRFDGRSSVLTWLTRIAINRCRTYQRRQWLRAIVLRRMRQEATERCAATDPITARETIQRVHAAIRELNQVDREVIVLRYLEELRVEEIAKTLGLSRGTVDVRLTRARRRLEKILQPWIEK